MQKFKEQSPQGMAGIVKYYEEEKSLIKMKPIHIVALCSGLFLIEVALFLI